MVSLPGSELLQQQAEWLSYARARMLRLAEIARRRRALDLGAGYGWITRELRRRTSGSVVALDLSLHAIAGLSPAVCASAGNLPFCNSSFDFVFSQNVLLWLNQPVKAIQEVVRVLEPGGVWVLFEPDYGGMIEHPPEISTKELWISALKRAEADPMVGRKLPFLLSKAGFRLRTELLPRLYPPSPERFAFLSELDLTYYEREQLEYASRASRELSDTDQVSHLPYFLIIAERC